MFFVSDESLVKLKVLQFSCSGAAVQNPAVAVEEAKDVETCTNELSIFITDDHSRITLKSENNHSNSDYINASPIVSIAYFSCNTHLCSHPFHILSWNKHNPNRFNAIDQHKAAHNCEDIQSD